MMFLRYFHYIYSDNLKDTYRPVSCIIFEPIICQMQVRSGFLVGCFKLDTLKIINNISCVGDMEYDFHHCLVVTCTSLIRVIKVTLRTNYYRFGFWWQIKYMQTLAENPLNLYLNYSLSQTLLTLMDNTASVINTIIVLHF